MGWAILDHEFFKIIAALTPKKISKTPPMQIGFCVSE